MDLGARRVCREAAELALGRLSFELLKALIKAAPNALSSDQIRERVWRAEHVSEETLKQRVSLLRRSLAEGDVETVYIETVHGFGYRLAFEPAPLAEPAVRGPIWAGWRRAVLFWLLVAVLLMVIGLLASGMRIAKRSRVGLAATESATLAWVCTDRPPGLADENAHAAMGGGPRRS